MQTTESKNEPDFTPPALGIWVWKNAAAGRSAIQVVRNVGADSICVTSDGDVRVFPVEVVNSHLRLVAEGVTLSGIWAESKRQR